MIVRHFCSDSSYVAVVFKKNKDDELYLLFNWIEENIIKEMPHLQDNDHYSLYELRYTSEEWGIVYSRVYKVMKQRSVIISKTQKSKS